MVRVVVDTNVLVSAFLNRGKSRKVVACLLEKHSVILSPQLLAELADVLSREKFGATNSQIERYISILIRQAKVVPAQAKFKIVLEDPDDDVVINTALTGKANYIVSGDKHLLKLACYKRIQIVPISEMEKIIAEKNR